jgi:hypothetical protein
MTVELASETRRAVDAANEEVETGNPIILINALNAFKGHELCENDPFVHGLVRPPNVEYSYHPNTSGQAALYRTLKAQLTKRGLTTP